MTVQIITDTACDLPPDIVDKFRIRVLPFMVHLDGRDHADGESIQAEDVYQAIRDGKQPKTGQVMMQRFMDAFTEYAEEGIRCIYVAFSAKMSGTCDTARLIAEEVCSQFPDFDISVCNSNSGSLGQGLIVYEAAAMAEQGHSKSTIVKHVEKRSQNNVEHIFTVDDLNYLYRGGRLHYASAFLGSILNVKPILHVRDGSLVPIQKVRGKKKAIDRIVQLVQKRAMGSSDQLIAISHAQDPEAAKTLKEKLRSKLGYTNFLVNTVGSVLGCHIGLGGVAAFFVNKSHSSQTAP